MRGMFLSSGVPNFATSDLWRTVSFCPGIFRVRVASVVFTNTVPSATASYSPCKFFSLRVVAMFFLANNSLGLVFANGSSNLDDSNLITRGMSPVSSFASFSFLAFASLTSLSLSRSDWYHLSSLIRSSCPLMLSSKYAWIVLDQSRILLCAVVVALLRAVLGFLPWWASNGDIFVDFFLQIRSSYVIWLSACFTLNGVG